MSSTTPCAGANSSLAGNAIEIAEVSFDQRQSTAVLLCEGCPGRNRRRIAVDAEDAHARRGSQNSLAIAAGAEGGVNVGFARCRR